MVSCPTISIFHDFLVKIHEEEPVSGCRLPLCLRPQEPHITPHSHFNNSLKRLSWIFLLHLNGGPVFLSISPWICLPFLRFQASCLLCNFTFLNLITIMISSYALAFSCCYGGGTNLSNIPYANWKPEVHYFLNTVKTVCICICTNQTNLEKSMRTLVATNCFLNVSKNCNVSMAILKMHRRLKNPFLLLNILKSTGRN